MGLLHHPLSSIALILAFTGTAVSASAFDKTLGDNQLYGAGSFAAYAAPYNKGSYVWGRDYTEGIGITASAFPGQSLLGWQWPDTQCPVGVYNFVALDYGNYYDTVVPMPVLPRKVVDIHKLSETHDAAYSGMLEGFDVIDDIFLTAVAGDHKSNAFEVEVLLHTPKSASSFVERSKSIGTFNGSGIRWTVAISTSAGTNAPDILFMPDGKTDIARGTIDLKAMLDYLVSQGAIPGAVYFNGFAFGAETFRGSGAVKVNSLSVTYD